jgi:hypothetical protein
MNGAGGLILEVKSQNQSHFTTGGLPPISSSWRQALEAVSSPDGSVIS